MNEGGIGRAWWRLAKFAMHEVACMAADACIVNYNNASEQWYMWIAKLNEQVMEFKFKILKHNELQIAIMGPRLQGTSFTLSFLY